MIDPRPPSNGAAAPGAQATPARITDPMSRTDDWGGPALEGPEQSRQTFPATFGRYHARREIARGGFGVVFEGWDPQLERAVAIKVPLPELLDSPEKSRAFLDEARRAVKLEHPGIVGVHDAGEADGFAYIVTQYIRGESLADRLARGRFAPEEASRLVARLAGVVHFAHTQGWVHRDIKPANVLLDEEGEAHLTDFGIATRLDDLRRAVGGAPGTPPYMPPEVVRPLLAGDTPGPADHRADVYALGVLLYESMTGRRPFDHDTRRGLFEQIVHAEPVPPRLLNPIVPERLEEICLRAMAKDPAKRHRTASDLRDALQPPMIDARPASPQPVAMAPRNAQPWLTAIVVALLVLIVVLVGMRLRPGSEAAGVPPVAPSVEPAIVSGGVAELRAWRDEREKRRETERAGLPAKPVPKAERPADDAWPKPFQALQQKIADAKLAGDEKKEFDSLMKATNELIETGHFEVARVAAERMVVISGKDVARVPFAYGQLGLAQYRLGDAEAAIASYEEAHKVYRGLYEKIEKFPDTKQRKESLGHLARLIGLMLNRVGNANKYLERYANAAAAYAEGQALLEKHDRKSELLTLLSNVGTLHSVRGEHAKAAEVHQRALAIAREIKDEREESELLINLGNSQSRAGDNESAIKSYERAYKLIDANATYEARTRVLINWITSLLEMGRAADANKLASQLRRIARPEDEDARKVLKLID